MRNQAGYKEEFFQEPAQRDNQLLSLAHIEVEKQMVARLSKDISDVCSSGFICWLHNEFYRHLPDSLHWANTKTGKTYRIVPGAFRDFMVDVGHHTRPHFAVIPAFLLRFQEFYGAGAPSMRPGGLLPSPPPIIGWHGFIPSGTATDASHVSTPVRL